jgi:hypothetical protein
MLPRKALALALKPLVPKNWVIKDGMGTMDEVGKTIVKIKQLTIERLPAAPLGKHLIGFVITISAPNANTQAAEDKLDDQVDDLIHALDGLRYEWKTATKVIDENRLAYDITMNMISTKKETP